MGKAKEANGAVGAEHSIKQLKECISDFISESDLYSDDFYLLRWLRAGSMDVTRAAKLLRNAAKWRKSYELESLLEENFPQDWLETMPIYVDAMSVDGVVVATAEAGAIDFRQIVEEKGKETAVRLMAQAFAQSEKVILERNKINFQDQPLNEHSIQGATLIVDFNNFSARQIQSFRSIQATIDVCKILVNYFPDLGSKFICINCNSVSMVILKILRSIIEGPHFKFEIYGSDENEWKPSILPQIPANQLRRPFGGTRDDGETIKRDRLVNPNNFLSVK
ncbi:unnamed protein product [Allacma fusca]|uniref:CRAL-TRIO domain-containing protein n=1 Tax=Allacma fusca TaxID=39272 RepID=A0A8J2JL17_9HEXA|nr:unnamed protein product [Allacma fusca]